jgi:hypothetical protein
MVLPQKYLQTLVYSQLLHSLSVVQVQYPRLVGNHGNHIKFSNIKILTHG